MASKDSLAKRIHNHLDFGRPDDVVVLFVPSHDKKNKKLADGMQDKWATEAIKLFGELFEGATAFRFLKGIYCPEGAEPMKDDPIMIQTLAVRDRTIIDKTWTRIGKFCTDMKAEMKQHSIGLAINDKLFFI